jgi:isoquinoline 1-oxidoreductase beta subunit
MVAFRNSYTECRDLAEASAILYRIPNLHIRHVNGLNPLRWGFLRSVDSGVQAFFAESFIDELAYVARQDPLAFRMAHCDERAKALLERVAQISNWGDTPPAGRARGVAIKEMYDTLVAQVAEVSVGNDGRVRVHAMYTAFDPGLVVNPGNLTAQVEGAVNFGLSATLFGQITFENGMVKEQNFPQYDIVRMADAPHQVVSFVESGARVGGGGEPGTPGVAPAVCNAIFALTGTRIRELPLRQFDLRTGARLART